MVVISQNQTPIYYYMLYMYSSYVMALMGFFTHIFAQFTDTV